MTDRTLRLIDGGRKTPAMDADYNLEPFAVWLRSWGASDRTVTARLSAVSAALRHLGDPATATEREIGAWIGSRDWSEWTRCTYFAHLRSFFEWARKSGLRVDDPTADMRRPRHPSCAPRPLSAAEQARVTETAQGDLLAWLLLSLYAGLRAFEVAKIRGEDVSEDVIYVVGKGGKRAMIPTHPLLWELAKTRPRYGYWFPSRGTQQHVRSNHLSARVSAHFSAVGIRGSLHRCRHTYATNLLRDGANIRVVQELMRHSSLKSTEIYTQVNDAEKVAAIRRLAA